MQGKSFHTILCCGLPAKKWYINQHPEEDWKNISQIMEILSTVECTRFILISTIDVFSFPELPNSEKGSHGYSTDPYGKHRHQFELFIQERFPDISYVVRLPALFGPFLKKNIIFDILENDQPQSIYLHDEYQFYPIWRLYEDIQRMQDEDIRLLHLFPQPIRVDTLVSWMKEGMERFHISNKFSIHLYKEEKKRVYQCTSVYAWCQTSNEEFYHHLMQYLSHYKFWKDHFTAMPLCCSPSDDMYTVFQHYGVCRFEMAPYAMWGENWEQGRHTTIPLSTPVPINEIVRLHGICYPHGWNMWDDYSQSSLFFKNVVEFLRHYNLSHIKGITMGSPKNRIRGNNYDYEIGVILREMDQTIFKHSSCTLDWEINSEKFGTDLFHTLPSFRDMKSENPSLSVVLDTCSCQLAGIHPLDFYREFNDNIRHIHFSWFRNFMDHPPPPSLWKEHQELWEDVVHHKTLLITLEITPPCTNVYEYLKFCYLK